MITPMSEITCPHCLEFLTDEQVKSLWAQRNAARRTPHAGPGRKKSTDRCPCGRYTTTKARARFHTCTFSPEACQVLQGVIDAIQAAGDADRTIQIAGGDWLVTFTGAVRPAAHPGAWWRRQDDGTWRPVPCASTTTPPAR